ncbi:nagb/rpia/CoA transferase-like protein [Thozetella sp. PMI_491]|nr:nagb/rpia/CoA transferase-like protein [Thozetella sp. PMI_491]
MATGEATAAESSLPVRPKVGGAQPFDIVETYRNLLASDPELSMSVAAIEALIALLGAASASTAMETVSIMKTQAERLHKSVTNPIPLRAGTDLFQQYLLRSLRGQPSGNANEPVLSFDETREHLLRNSRVFASRAKAARDAIAERGSKYVTNGSVVLAAGGSRTVRKILLRAADSHREKYGTPKFKVIYVMDGSRDCGPAVAALREAEVKVDAIDLATVAHSLSADNVDMVFVGTEALLQNGGLLSRMGTYQLALLCQALNKKFYVAAETHKIARVFVLSPADLKRCGVQQDHADAVVPKDGEESGVVQISHKVDYTPPEYISSIITEQGIKTPTQIYEMILDIYT